MIIIEHAFIVCIAKLFPTNQMFDLAQMEPQPTEMAGLHLIKLEERSGIDTRPN